MATLSVQQRSPGGLSGEPSPAEFDPEQDLPQGFLEFLAPLHQSICAVAANLLEDRKQVLAQSHQGDKPVHRFPGTRCAGAGGSSCPNGARTSAIR